MGENICTAKKNIGTSLAASKESGLQVNTDKTKNTVTSCKKNAGQKHNIMVCSKSLWTVTKLKYLGTALTNQKSIHQ